jgi:carnitine 3-dehydrogenase
MSEIKIAGLVGGGVIGSGWAARLLLNGIDVALYDPDPEIARKLDAVLDNARRAYAKLLPGRRAAEGRLRLAPSIASAVAEADFIQESLPEREDLKVGALAEIERAARPETIIASSTSGLLPSRLQVEMAHPGRFVVGHPFNPVYLLPLVEICGGVSTTAATKTRVAKLYADLGMHPLHIRKEVDGFIADRLLEALWREALWLVEDGIATTAEIDDAVRYGAGLRWSFMGTFLIYRLAGGEAGMRHFLSQFGPALKLPWTKLEAPELTPALIERIAEQSDAQAAGASIRELERQRDDCLVAVLAALRRQDYAAGAALKRYQAALAGGGNGGNGAAASGNGLLRLHATEVAPDWLDYNGHMTEHRYLQVFGDTSDALLRHIGVDAAYCADGFSYYTVETHIMHRREVRGGEKLHVTTQLLGVDDKRLHLYHALYRSRDEVLLAGAEQMLLHVDAKANRACRADAAVLARLQALAAAQRDLAWPEGAGRAIGMPERG